LFDVDSVEMTILLCNKTNKIITPDILNKELKKLCFKFCKKEKRRHPEKRFLEKEEYMNFGILLNFPEWEIGNLGSSWLINNNYPNKECNICLQEKCGLEFCKMKNPDPTAPDKSINACECKIDICKECIVKINKCPYCRPNNSTSVYEI
jgi:hypothetical protein